MSIDLLSLAKSALGDNVLGQLADSIGESPDTTRRAVDAGIPAILGGLLSKASSSDGVSEILTPFKTTMAAYSTTSLDHCSATIKQTGSAPALLLSQ